MIRKPRNKLFRDYEVWINLYTVLQKSLSWRLSPPPLGARRALQLAWSQQYNIHFLHIVMEEALWKELKDTKVSLQVFRRMSVSQA